MSLKFKQVNYYFTRILRYIKSTHARSDTTSRSKTYPSVWKPLIVLYVIINWIVIVTLHYN